ncbi:MAG: bifunctional 5,10-methylenetetrahydrofolate dehydrogenase/5,10-methenyltetrahydrofolate cyclohydrolase [Saprospiraceae bacterium]
MILLDGKKLSKEIKKEIKEEVDSYLSKKMRAPKLVTVLVGDDKASQSYVRSKIKSCGEVGFLSENYNLPENTKEEELLDLISKLNEDSTVDGFIVQLPLPKHIDEEKVLLSIDPTKDVDGFHPYNIGKLLLGIETFTSATPLGILEMLKRYNIKTESKDIAVIGRSNIVGKPIGIALVQKMYPGNASVSYYHSYTKDLKNKLLRADIIIAAIGKAKFVTEDMVKEGAVIIDVGMNSVYDESLGKSKLVGDVDFENVKSKVDYITPVPGGVGLMTVASLMLNTLKSYKLRNGIY